MSARADVMRNREAILVIAKAHGVSHVRLFGSSARGTDRTDSDVDILVRADSATLFDLAAMEEKIEQLLGRKVQVVSEGGLKPALRAHVLDEAVEV